MSIKQIVKKKNSLVNQILKSKNSSVYSIDDSETEKEEVCMIIEKEENQPKKYVERLTNNN